MPTPSTGYAFFLPGFDEFEPRVALEHSDPVEGVGQRLRRPQHAHPLRAGEEQAHQIHHAGDGDAVGQLQFSQIEV